MATTKQTGPRLTITSTCEGCCHLRIEEVRRSARRRERTVLCAHPAFPDGMGLAPVGGGPFATPERCPELPAARLALARGIVAEAQPLALPLPGDAQVNPKPATWDDGSGR